MERLHGSYPRQGTKTGDFFLSGSSLHHALLMFAISGAVLAYEVLLMRLLSIAFWHYFASMVISMALLGFGAAGSLLFVIFPRLKKHLETWLVLLGSAAAVSFSLSFSLSRMTGLDPLNLTWQGAEWFRMGITYVLMSLPFLLSGCVVGILLTIHGSGAHLMYGINLIGSAAGALGIAPALFLGPPWRLIPALAGMVLLGSLGCCVKMARPWKGISILCVAAAMIGAFQGQLPAIPDMHHTKALPVTLTLPDARIEIKRAGPLGLIHVVGSSHIRDVPGLSLKFGQDDKGFDPSLPEQKVLFLDGDEVGPIARFSGSSHETAYLDYTTVALPYFVRRPEGILVIGAGAGSDILLGLRHEVQKIIALEFNRQIVDVLTGPLAEFSGDLFARPQVTAVVQEARRFLYHTDDSFDLIQLSLVDAFGASSGGLYAAEESYLYTMEAMNLYLRRLTDSGMLAMTRWLKLPPRDSLRILTTALAVLKRSGWCNRPERHILFIRSWKTCTLLVSKSPFTREELQRAETFCDERSFDPAYHWAMTPDRANRYDVQEEAFYYNGARALSGPDGASFQEEYPFDLSPTMDDRPYFSHFFSWSKSRELFQRLGRDWIHMTDLGYILILATLVQTIPAGGLLIMMPLALRRWTTGLRQKKAAVIPPSRLLGTLCYFGVIGLGFMFIEMSLLPKYTLLLGHPIYSAAAVLGTLLFFAGLGSVCARRLAGENSSRLWIAIVGIAAWIAFQITTGDLFMEKALIWPLKGRVVLGVIMLSPLSFLMGWPFPSGIRVTAKTLPEIIPWAWAINGCASVVGVVLAKCLCMDQGFRLVMLAAGILYITAGIVFYVFLAKPDSLKNDVSEPKKAS